MRLAIVHYHLRKGGVTRVIAAALEALGPGAGEVVVLSSGESEEPLPCRVVVVPELAYTGQASAEAAAGLYSAMKRSAASALGGSPDLWHIHNHCLGKNVNFPEAMRRLLDDGARMLLQIHDFAEDGRPANYRAQRAPYDAGTFGGFDASLYPCAPQIGYAVLNGRDRGILAAAGVPAERLFWLANAVTTPPLQEESPEASSGKPLILYPTRAIRRKNVGELLLMAVSFPQYRFATTLSPKNPQWEDTYRAWVDLAGELDLDVAFGLGERPGSSFEGLIREASAMVTTSVGEGFGLAFLEPWLFGKPVCGRDLPEVTDDFRDNGIRLPGLYREWQVALDLFDSVSFRKRLFEKVNQAYQTYNRSVGAEALEASWNEMTTGGTIDFGVLDESAQAGVLRSLAQSPAKARAAPLSLGDPDPSVIGSNSEIIRTTYGLKSYGEKLQGIYRSLMDAAPGQPQSLDAPRILDAFLDLKRFRLLRS
jgi:hypothetical protein